MPGVPVSQTWTKPLGRAASKQLWRRLRPTPTTTNPATPTPPFKLLKSAKAAQVREGLLSASSKEVTAAWDFQLTTWIDTRAPARLSQLILLAAHVEDPARALSTVFAYAQKGVHMAPSLVQSLLSRLPEPEALEACAQALRAAKALYPDSRASQFSSFVLAQVITARMDLNALLLLLSRPHARRVLLFSYHLFNQDLDELAGFEWTPTVEVCTHLFSTTAWMSNFRKPYGVHRSFASYMVFDEHLVPWFLTHHTARNLLVQWGACFTRPARLLLWDSLPPKQLNAELVLPHVSVLRPDLSDPVLADAAVLIKRIAPGSFHEPITRQGAIHQVSFTVASTKVSVATRTWGPWLALALSSQSPADPANLSTVEESSTVEEFLLDNPFWLSSTFDAEEVLLWFTGHYPTSPAHLSKRLAELISGCSNPQRLLRPILDEAPTDLAVELLFELPVSLLWSIGFENSRSWAPRQPQLSATWCRALRNRLNASVSDESSPVFEKLLPDWENSLADLVAVAQATET